MIALAPKPLHLPGADPVPRRDTAPSAQVAHKFETLIAATLLRAARATSLGDDGLGTSGGPVRDLVDQHRAEAIARAAPLGVADLLTRQEQSLRRLGPQAPDPIHQTTMGAIDESGRDLNDRGLGPAAPAAGGSVPR